MNGARAPIACDPERTRGREFALEEAGSRGPRSAYQRDRDRIIHSIAFRRLRYKTQVFIAPDGDHYRVRVTHSLEVAQIARVIARALGLDEGARVSVCYRGVFGTRDPLAVTVGRMTVALRRAHAGAMQVEAV